MKSYDAPCAGTVQIMGHQKNPARTADMVEIWILSVKRGKTSRITEKTCSRILHPETLVQTKSKFFDRITNSSPLAADVATRGSIAGKHGEASPRLCAGLPPLGLGKTTLLSIWDASALIRRPDAQGAL